MPNAHLEQNLIDSFVNLLQTTDDDALRCMKIGTLHNKRCGSSDYADVEFTSVSGQRWAIEAKYGSNTDKANEVHKLFGNLLKETGRENRADCRIGLLLPDDRHDYYRCGVRRIDRAKFLKFGEIVPVDTVFVLHQSNELERQTWEEFYGPTPR